MRYILGMAKSALDLRGAKSRNLRLDVELLGRAIEELSDQGHSATAYVLVLSEEVGRAAERWSRQQRHGDSISVIVPRLSRRELEDLEAEKRRNARGISSGVPEDSIARVGKSLAEDKLRRSIARREPASRDSRQRPLGVNWDYVGVVSEK